MVGHNVSDLPAEFSTDTDPACVGCCLFNCAVHVRPMVPRNLLLCYVVVMWSGYRY